MAEIKKDKTEKLVIERVVETGDSDSIAYKLKHGYDWHDIANYEKRYKLDMLLNEGWEIIDTKVATAIGISGHGYAKRQDHTIIILEKTI